MTDTDHLIWSNYHIDYEDWREDLEADYPDLTEDERYRKMLEINSEARRLRAGVSRRIPSL